MKRTILAALAIVPIAGALAQPEKKPPRDIRPVPVQRVPQPAKPAPQGDKPAAPPMMNAAPGPEHAQLAKLAGEWTSASTFRLTPDAEPQTSAGTARFTTVLGGRFISEEDSGDMMGQPFSSLKV